MVASVLSQIGGDQQIQRTELKTSTFLTFLFIESWWWTGGSRASVGATGLAGNRKGFVEALG